MALNTIGRTYRRWKRHIPALSYIAHAVPAPVRNRLSGTTSRDGAPASPSALWAEPAFRASMKAAPAETMSHLPVLRRAFDSMRRGDWGAADAVLATELARKPNALALRVFHIQSAAQSGNWPAVVARWQETPATERLTDRARASYIHALITLSQFQTATAELGRVLAKRPSSVRFRTLRADLNAAQGNWAEAAAEIRSLLTNQKLKGREPMRLRFIDLLRKAGRFEEADEICFGRNPRFAVLRVELAIDQGSWIVALERWQQIERGKLSAAGTFPTRLAERFGLARAIEANAAVPVKALRASGAFAIARALASANPGQALAFARQARGQMPMTATLWIAEQLRLQTKLSAARWWLERLTKHPTADARALRDLTQVLIEVNDLDAAEHSLTRYVRRRGEDGVFLRFRSQILYMRGDFVGLSDLLAWSLRQRPLRAKGLAIFDWAYQLIRSHPEPRSFLPANVQEAMVKSAQLHDQPRFYRYLSTMLIPEAGDRQAEVFAKILAKPDVCLPPKSRQEMAEFYLQRRDWSGLDRALAPSSLTGFNPDDIMPTWQLVRIKVDVLMGRAQPDAAEAELVAFLNLLLAEEQFSFLLGIAEGVITRFPASADVIGAIEQAAEQLNQEELGRKAELWRTLYTDRRPEALVGTAGRRRCFVVGNAPSLSQLDLSRLEGEVIFSVNRGMRAMQIGLPTPDYLFVADQKVYKSHWDELDADARQVKHFFATANCLWARPGNERAYAIGTSQLKLSLAPFPFAPWALHRGESVVVLAAQMAQLIGFTEIVIIGVDLDYAGDATHFYGTGARERQRLDNFRPGGSGTELVNLAFGNLQKVVEPLGARMYNATPGGYLTALPRVSFEDATSDRPL